MGQACLDESLDVEKGGFQSKKIVFKPGTRLCEALGNGHVYVRGWMSDNLKAFFLDICVGSEKGRFGGNDMPVYSLYSVSDM